MVEQPNARSALVCSAFAGGWSFPCPGFVDDQDWRALWALVRVGRAWRAAFGGALRHLPDRLAANDAALGAVLGAIPEVARRLAAALDGLETPAIAEVLPMKRLPHGLGPVFSAAVLLSGVCRPTATTNWELLVRNKPNSWPACVTLIRKAGGARALVAALRAARAAACGQEDDDKWVIIKVEKDAGGIRLDDYDKKKVAKKKLAKLEKKGRTGILVKGGKVKDVTKSDNDHEEKEVVFMVGVAVGRGMLKRGDLGPLDEGGQYDIFDESDDDWGSASDSD